MAASPATMVNNIIVIKLQSKNANALSIVIIMKPSLKRKSLHNEGFLLNAHKVYDDEKREIN